MKRALLIGVCLLLVACGSAPGDDVASQIRGNQGLLLVLQNAADLNHMYFYYNGPESDAAGANYQPSRAGDWVTIGELNLLLHNIGGSATAGGLYVSGYDPNLIDVVPHFGQGSINTERRNCITDVGVASTGQYDVTYFCPPENQGDIAYGGRVTDNGGVVTIGNLPLDQWLDDIASDITGNNVDFFTNIGLFDYNRVDCGVQSGEFSCRVAFGSGNFDPNRASHGYLLVNLLYGQLLNCVNNCLAFPATLSKGIALAGVSDEYPLGDALYRDYYILLDRSKWNPLLNDLKQTFQITACYLYTTTVTPTVCVDPDPASNVNEPCSTAPLTFRDSQGAPIKVTSIEQQARPGATAFTIHIEHIGDGQVWLPNSFDSCSPYAPGRPDMRNQNAVQLLDARILGDFQQLRCLPDNSQRIVRLVNGKGQITCLYPVTGPAAGTRAAYQSALTLEFGYLYQNTVRKDVIIHRT